MLKELYKRELNKKTLSEALILIGFNFYKPNMYIFENKEKNLVIRIDFLKEQYTLSKNDKKINTFEYCPVEQALFDIDVYITAYKE